MPLERDILAEPDPAPAPPAVAATAGLVVEHRASGFVGDVVAVGPEGVTLRNRHGKERLFRWQPGGFLLDGRPVTLVRPRPAGAPAPRRTASGSVASAHRPQVARAARIFVEGVHDAELLEQVWGDDLREAAIVVEPLDGADHLVAAVQRFRPGPGRRLGVLLDHLVPGSKESRLAATVSGPHVLVTGTPYVDVWQAVRPAAAGIPAWPAVPPGVPWKEGVCRALGVADPGAFWRRLRTRVRSYADLEPDLVGAVEQLLDFLTEEDP